MSSRMFFFTVTLLTAALVATVTAGYFVWQSRPGTGTVEIGGPYTLTDHTGRAVTQESYAGRWQLVFFGYTFCPDFCPATLSTVTAAMDSLGPAGDKITPIFITVDPERDTVEQMAAYHEHFHPSFQMLTGTPEQIAAVARAYRVYYAKAESEQYTDYLMDHSTITYLMDPQGRYAAHFSHGTEPEALARQLREHVGG